MARFKPIDQRKSDTGDNLMSKMSVVSLPEAEKNTSFREPVRLHRIWHELPRERRQIPALKADTFGPALLPHMYILDVILDSESDEIDFRWRLFGSTHTDRYKKEATGSYLSKAAANYPGAASSYEIAQWVFEHRQAAFYITKYSDDVGPVRSTSTVALPVLDASGDVSHIFGCSIWQSLKTDC